VSDKCKDLIRKLLTVNPAKRVRIDDIKRHPFFKQGEAQILKEIPFENEKHVEVIIDQIGELLGNSREEILYNIENNRHNNITTSYELLLKKYKLNLGDKQLASEPSGSTHGYKTTRNKTVDTFNEPTKNINININYINKIGNININYITDPKIGEDKKGSNKMFK